MIVRDEHASDRPAVAKLVEQAFGRPDEAELVERLRGDGNATIALVAVEGARIIGHVLLSPMSAPFRALGLAPLSIAPDRHGAGIGSKLARAAIERAGEGGWRAIFVLGDPGFYARFGFEAESAAGFASPYAGPHLMVLPLGGALPAEHGRVDYARAFDRLA